LTRLISGYAKPYKKWVKVIEKTHHELAYELGTAREVVFRHLKIFEGYGWVNLKLRTVDIINREALMRVCNKSE